MPIASTFARLSVLLLLAEPLMAEMPPVAPVRIVTDTYHGTPIADPYRYLEDFQQPDVQAWVKEQAEFAERTLSRLPGRGALLARIEELDAGAPFTLSGLVRQPGGRLFYFKQLAGEKVAKVCLREGTTGTERVLVDPEKFPQSMPDEHYTISFFRVSPESAKLLYGFAASGSEQTTLRVLEIATGRDLPDAIDRLEADYAPPYWLPDGESFVYSRRRKLAADAPATEGYKFTQAWRHVLGRDTKQDELVLAAGAAGSPPLAEMDFPAVIVPVGSRWAIGQVKHGDETDLSLYVAPLAALGRPELQWTQICGRADLVTDYAVRGDDLYLLTARDAPRFKIVRTSLAQPNLAGAATVVPAGEYVVDGLAVASDALYVETLVGTASQVLRVPFGEEIAAERIELPADEPSGSILAARPDLPGVFIGTRSWTRAGRLYQFEAETRTLTDTRLLPVGKFDVPDSLTATEVLVASHDGVRVPLSIVHRRDLVLDGSHPTLISGYGAYGFTAPMRFNPTDLAWLERGGVLAVAHVRGGGAFGKAWHHAGRKLTKPNTWKDFIACAEHLVRAGYTSPKRLAGKGGSAGGILIGRAITERPDLFAAAQISVGCTDMLRFETTTNGPPNIPEFGTVTKPDEFRGLLEMSTFYHIRDGVKYPAVILTHGINDPRVEPWESAKTTARLQAASASARPVLFRVDYHAGHGIGSTRQQRHAELADVWSFLFWQIGDPEFQPR
ncbi:MAG: prolyl oligopeptidase family serine peptidase [Pirellulaceae bacterium]|nr:prolyl oligopeptidase family serine peptidase [Pirellulaceae bacterium]